MVRLLRWLPLFLFIATVAVPQGASAQTIQDVHVFQAAGTPGGEGSFLMEITGQSFPTPSPTVFLAPRLTKSRQPQVVLTPEVVLTTDSRIVIKFTAPKGYFPKTVGVAGTGGAFDTMDVPSTENAHSGLPRIDDVEVLQLNRINGTGRIKIDGAGFGNDPNKISVAIVPHDPALPVFKQVLAGPYDCPDLTTSTDSDGNKKRVESTEFKEAKQKPPEATTASDGIVVVDFSFPCSQGYSQPLRIARILLTAPDKDGQPSTASYEMLPGRDKNLTYRSTILSEQQASSRFGGGVAKNFYVVQLSIVNKGPVKMQVPLASIQAEVEWLAGFVTGKGKDTYYREGPATVAPVPLAGAVSYFSTHRDATGARAKFFNILQGVTTVGSAIQLFFGPGFAQGVGIAGGGLRQGLEQIFKDLSPQQLANLTSQSFESIESVSGNGGSIEKVIFIQRTEEKLESGDPSYKFGRLIDNIIGFEINGYEAPETPAKAATPQQP